MEATTEQQKAEGREIVRVLAAVLDRLVTANAPLAVADPGQVTKFHAMKAPGIAIEQYLERYVRFLGHNWTNYVRKRWFRRAFF